MDPFAGALIKTQDFLIRFISEILKSNIASDSDPCWFPSVRLTIRVPIYLLFGFNLGTQKKKGKRVLLGNLAYMRSHSAGSLLFIEFRRPVLARAHLATQSARAVGGLAIRGGILEGFVLVFFVAPGFGL